MLGLWAAEIVRGPDCDYKGKGGGVVEVYHCGQALLALWRIR
jgi:hypothetical protein